jgi:cytoskeleton protein RodZ
VPNQVTQGTIADAPTMAAPTIVPAVEVAVPAATATSAAAAAGASAAAPLAAVSAPAAVASEAKAAPAPIANGGAVAVFTTREPSWVQVVDAAGLVHLRKTMDGGESVSINGTMPLSVVIGRANAIDIVVRGKPFDLQAVAKDNVARFQIK